MATGKITKKSVEAVPLPPKKSGKREYLWDDTLKGFGLMATDSGVRSYIVQYRIGGRGSPTRRVTIGKHGSPWTAEKARIRAADLLEQVRKQIDPFDAERAKVAAERQRKKDEAEAARVTTKLAFDRFADDWVTKYAKVEQPKTWADTDSIVRRDLKPFFGNRPLPSITPALIVELLDKVQERGDSAAIKAYKALRSLFGWAVTKHQIAASPMLNIKPPAKIAARDRTLTDDELRLAWLAAGGLGYPFGPIIRLLILTGQRRDEVGEMVWSEVDKGKKQWLLPAARAKNGHANLVPLSDPALAIIKDLPVIKSEAGLVFTTTGETPVSGFSKVKARLDKSMLDLMQREAREGGADEEDIAKLAMSPWTLHDLRRTLASGCQRLGVKLEVTEAVLNHVSGTRSGIVGVYQTYRYETEKRDALDTWARHVDAVVTGAKADNVVAMGRWA